MEEPRTMQLEIQVDVSDASDEEIDRLTRQLLSELRHVDEIEAVELSKNDAAPKGTKGDALTVGSIAVELLSVAVPSVIALIQAWMLRGQGRTIKFRSKGLEFEGSPEEFQKLLDTLPKGGKKREQ